MLLRRICYVLDAVIIICVTHLESRWKVLWEELVLCHVLGAVIIICVTHLESRWKVLCGRIQARVR